MLVQEGSLGTQVMSSEQGAILKPQGRLRSEAWTRVRVRAERARRREMNIFAVLDWCVTGRMVCLKVIFFFVQDMCLVECETSETLDQLFEEGGKLIVGLRALLLYFFER